jgi:hypothetical protein
MAIEFRCSQCNQLLRVPDASAGNNARCPKCQTLMTVPPSGGASAAAPLPSVPSAPSSPSSAPQSPFAPSAPAEGKDPFAFLDTGAGGGSPPPAPPPQPAGNPFGDAKLPSPFGGPAMGNVNPYASPSAYAGYTPTTDFAGQRIGLPWENEPRTLGCWFRTLGMILGSPSRAFSIMRQSGGLGTPILYNVYGLGLPLLVLSLLVLPLLLILMLSAGGNGNANNAAAAAGFTFGFIAVFAVFMVLYVLLAATIGNLFAAGIWHLFLMMCGGARQGYETTFRVTSFVYGSLAWLGFIPYIGGCALTIWMVVLLIIGLAKAHEIPAGKAALAVLLPFGICVGGYILLIVLLISTAALQN